MGMEPRTPQNFRNVFMEPSRKFCGPFEHISAQTQSAIALEAGGVSLYPSSRHWLHATDFSAIAEDHRHRLIESGVFGTPRPARAHWTFRRHHVRGQSH